MSYSHEELKILMAENALDNAKVHTARMKRRAHHAESEYATAMVEEERFKEAVEALRANYLKKVPTMTKRDAEEFKGYLRNCTDRQVMGVYEKELKAGRDEYALMAYVEAERRNLV